MIANRSAAFYRLNDHELTLQDVDLALNESYPAKLRYKVLDRRARCLLALHQYGEAREAFRATLLALDEASDLDVEKRRKWQMDVQIMLKMMDKTKPKDVSKF